MAMQQHLKPYIAWGSVLGLIAAITFFLGF